MKSTNNQRTPKISRFRGAKFIALMSTMALLLFAPATQAQSGHNGSSCHFISGFIHGQLIGPNAHLCPIPGSTEGALTEIGTFTDSDDNVLGTFVACATSFEQRGDGALMFGLAHTYTTTSGDTFTTTDSIVASPVDPPLYGVNNHADITGGSGNLLNAFGHIRDHGTVNLATEVVSVEYSGQICTPE
jgi:hypothetical protein